MTTFDPTPGKTFAIAAAQQLRGGGHTSWPGPAFTNPTFTQAAAFAFGHDAGIVCGNCCGPSKRTGPQERQCIKCGARWQTLALTSEELQIEKLRAVEAAKR
jgi:hypothetical protein